MTTQAQPRTSHPFYMYDAVHGQPEAVARVLESEADAVGVLAHRLNTDAIEFIHVVGIGTSWHAALVGEYLLRFAGGRTNARAWNSFEFCAYPPPLGSGDAVIVLSHRGTKLYSAQALELAQASGALTVLVTGIDSSAKTDLANVVLRTCPQEKSSAFTVSHIAAMTVLAMLASAIGEREDNPVAGRIMEELANLPQLVDAALAQESEVRRWVKGVANAERYYFAGWGPNASTAYEVALKIKETSYATSEGFQLEQYLHGPFVATEEGGVVTFVAPSGKGRWRTRNLVEAAGEVGAHVAAILEQGDDELSDMVDTSILLPAMPEFLTPIVYLVPLQLFTYWLARELGHNPDVFRLDDPKHRAARGKYQL